ncbi:MAG TPA: hypothetical protein VH397_08170 [Xanthobacteraceae bacterium]
MPDGARASATAGASVRRRHVIYVEGYDPQGAEGYYRLFGRSLARFLKVWPLAARLSELELESRDFARWTLEASGPNWQVATRYDFLRQEHFIRANMAEPLTRQIPRALAWAFDYLVSGAIFRVLRASPYFGLVLIYFQLMLIAWMALSVAGGWLVAALIMHLLGLPGAAAMLVGVAAAILVFLALRRLVDRWFVVQINNHWPYLCAFARGEATCFDAAIEAGARRVVAAVDANDADEVVVVGHSGGGALAPAVVVRALELDPEVGRKGPPLILLTLGSIAPGAALHPRAARLRATFARLAVEPSVTWIDSQSRADVLNFWDFDPVEGIGARVEGRRCNPLIWKVRFGDMLSRRFYWRIRFNFFRLHYQFVMASDRRAPYDYFMLLSSPVPVAAWARNPSGVLAAFAADGSLAAERAASPATA